MVFLFPTCADKKQSEGKVCVYGVSCGKSLLVFPNKNYPVRWFFATAVVLIKLGISLERKKRKNGVSFSAPELRTLFRSVKG